MKSFKAAENALNFLLVMLRSMSPNIKDQVEIMITQAQDLLKNKNENWKDELESAKDLARSGNYEPLKRALEECRSYENTKDE
jgi:hypothetical protein